MYVDTHNHLAFWSQDATQTYEELMAAAKELGLIGVTVTDHYDIGVQFGYEREWIFDPEAYFEALAPYRRAPSTLDKAEGEPGFLIGIEANWEAKYTDRLNKLFADWPFDQIILSIHLLDGIDPYLSPELIFKDGAFAVYRKLIDVTADSAEACPTANVIGHYDYFSRYQPEPFVKMRYEHAPEAFDRLFTTMIRQKQCLEYNTGTLNRLVRNYGLSINEGMPDPTVLRRFLELGGQYITLSSDAHHKGALGKYHDIYIDWLRDHGVTHLTHYEKQKPVLTPI